MDMMGMRKEIKKQNQNLRPLLFASTPAISCGASRTGIVFGHHFDSRFLQQIIPVKVIFHPGQFVILPAVE